MKNNKNAISLIVLVVTILVLAILAAAVIISLSNANIMGEASKTVFKSDMANYKEVYELYVTKKTIGDITFNRNTLNVTNADNPSEFKEIFGDKVPDKYKDGLKVVNGKLVYETTDEIEKAVLDELVIASTSVILPATVKQLVGTVPIPNGFYYVGGTKTTGLVISDSEADVTNGLTGTTAGNQFVWVPVEGYTKTGNTTSHQIYTGTDKARTVNLYNSFTSVFRRGDLQETLSGSGIYKMTGTTLSTSYIEPYSSGYPNESDEYYAMMESVQEYGGFYIARFEAGDGDATDGTNNVEKKARSGITVAHKVVSKKGAYVYNCVPWGLNITTITPSAGSYYFYDVSTSSWGTKSTDIVVAGAVYLSQHMYENHESVVSTLCYGVQWDAAMNFVSDADHNISDSRSWGNHSDSTEDAETNRGSLQKTGTNEAWQAKNIYDLAGNVFEWTMEAGSSDNRNVRGGNYYVSGSRYPASERGSNNPPILASGNGGFRPALYIKVE